ncbi:hypothetical protein [Halolamina salifodinae]|uniref:Uncharacterized protein n=1 Tax=Halolamina salifodinae TaxID=1202767 RepID=A0A8T4H5I7_9EURY|nr:hypothetical protein [Halolamina salifodinae]MBP1988388.1 hypothetical protein [Halolamina salifodinae]
MDTTDWLLLSLILVGFANWQATDAYGGVRMAYGGLALAAFVVMLDLSDSV